MSPSNSSEVSPFNESRFLTIAGERIHYWIWKGQKSKPGSKLLLIHGFGGSTFSWRFLGPALCSAGHDVIAVDLPGFGYSGRESASTMNDRSWTSLMWKVLELIESRDIEEDTSPSTNRKWTLVGHSIGARVAASMSARLPDRVSGLILVDAALYGPPVAAPLLGLPPLRWIVSKWVQNQLFNERGVFRILASAYGRPPKPEEVAGYLEPLLIPGTARVVLKLGNALPEISAGDLRKISCRSLIVWGENDTWVDMKNALRIFNDIPVAEIYLIPGAGHLPMETHTEQLFTRIEEFLSDC